MEGTMSPRLKLWLFSTLLYALFVIWYTDFSGPLTDEELDKFVATMTANGGEPETVAFMERFGREDNGRQFLMLNAVDYNENPPDVSGAAPGETAEQLMGRYMGYMFPALLARASHPVFMGPAIYPSMDLVGIGGAEHWDMGALFRYRSRRTFLEIVTNPAFAGKHQFKTAALDKTIAYPVEPRLYLGDLRLVLGLVLLALTAVIDSLSMGRRLARQQSLKKE
jgi:hypothetical protein